ncbi:MAG: O-antigen ligase family protein [Prosthecobacter sp.]|nr:O-antigen ligase family protein [Prosthecobacter sp.]
MDFVAICIAILLWLVRPQDWLSGLAGVGFMRYAMLIALYGMYTRPGGLRPKLFFQSPADVLICAYLIWIIWTTGEWYDTAKEILPFAAFYYTAALALNTPKRLATFLSCWIAGLSVVILFGLSTEFGMELAPGSADLRSYFEGRLALNTWIFNNPNSLGHGVVTVIPLAYVWFWWRKPILMKILGCVVALAAGYCVYLTESKGAYLCGAAALGIAILFRKRLIFQVIVVLLALTMGITALKTLPRMENLSAQEDGIAGRLVIWQMAHNAMVNTDTGEGWKKFEAWITIPKIGTIHKATHGSYVNVGADLGYPGLFLFLAILYANARTVLQARPPPEDETSDRCQRALLVLVSGYAASAWIIDRAYHTDFFLIAGAISAFHRQMTRQTRVEATSDETEPDERESAPEPVHEPSRFPLPELFPVPKPGLLFASGSHSVAVAARHPGETVLVLERQRAENTAAAMSMSKAEPGTQKKLPLTWRRLGILDLILIYVVFQAVLYIWVEIMTNFISF